LIEKIEDTISEIISNKKDTKAEVSKKVMEKVTAVLENPKNTK